MSAEEHAKLDDSMRGFYVESDDGYQLQVDGAVDKSKLGEFRDKNIELMSAQEKFKGVDLEKYAQMQERDRQLRDKELIEAKDFDTLIAERTSTLKSDYEAKLKAANDQLSATASNHTSLLTRYEIEGAASKAFVEHKINPQAFDSVMAQIKSKFTIDNGSVIARDGDTILTGANGNLTVSEFVASQPEIFKLQSTGGNGQGNKVPEQQRGASSQDKIKSGLGALMSKGA